MDPHSSYSQFNQRTTKAGPIPLSRFVEPTPKAPIGSLPKRPMKSSASSSAPRLIVTNSRVKQDEKYRKDMFLAYVSNALQQKSNGNNEPFNELVDQFNPKRPRGDGAPVTPQLRLWLLALSHMVSQLERQHAPLVDAIVNMPWFTMDTTFVNSYIDFTGMLLSARPEYLSLVLGKIAQGFTHQYGLRGVRPDADSGPITHRETSNRLHHLLRHLLSLIPTLPSTLHPFLVANFPHKRLNHLAQAAYIRNLLQITEYCSALADRILAIIVDRAMQIDVEIQVELEELEEMEPSQEADPVFELDPFDTIIGQEADDTDSEAQEEDDDDDDHFSDLSSDAGDEGEEELVDVPSNLRHVRDMVKKLDAILKLLFDHFNHIHAAMLAPPPLPETRSGPPESTNPPRTSSPLPPSPEATKLLCRSHFQTLLSIFDRTIIRTFKSRYTQFLVFWYASLDSEFSDLFQGLLVSKALLEHEQPIVTRAAAACYIASFISRARFVDREGARRVTSMLCHFLTNHLDTFDGVVQAGMPLLGQAHHDMFYAVVQSVFLIFCFRWRDLMEEQEEDGEVSLGPKTRKIWMAELNVVHRAVHSQLNPLKVCSSNVVLQFARVAQMADFIYCYPILESNRRSNYASSSHPTTPTHQRPTIANTTAVTTNAIHPTILSEKVNSELNTFFPFDPYKLPKSSMYIQGIYREWASVAIDGEDDEEEDDEEEEDEEGDDRDDDGEGHNDDPRRLGVPLGGGRVGFSHDEDDELGVSFEGMSISPAPHLLPAAS